MSIIYYKVCVKKKILQHIVDVRIQQGRIGRYKFGCRKGMSFRGGAKSAVYAPGSAQVILQDLFNQVFKRAVAPIFKV